MTAAHHGEPARISDETVRHLVSEQFPQLAGEELGRRYTLEDQFAIRLGDEYGAIFPRYPEYDEYYARVTKAIGPQARQWSFPCSYPLATGVPSADYPWHWTLVKWIAASTSAFVPLHGDSLRPLGDALRQIHQLSPADAPINPQTGKGLEAIRDDFTRMVDFAVNRGAPEGYVLDDQSAWAVFNAGAATPVDVEFTWTHGRIEPRAVLSDQGEFAGMLLWHNFGAGDPAADLGYAANIVPRSDLGTLLSAYGPLTEATGQRALAYQVVAAVRYIEVDDPFLLRMAWERLIELGLARMA